MKFNQLQHHRKTKWTLIARSRRTTTSTWTWKIYQQPLVSRFWSRKLRRWWSVPNRSNNSKITDPRRQSRSHRHNQRARSITPLANRHQPPLPHYWMWWSVPLNRICGFSTKMNGGRSIYTSTKWGPSRLNHLNDQTHGISPHNHRLHSSGTSTTSTKWSSPTVRRHSHTPIGTSRSNRSRS